ncbi:MAG: hypothetical protein IH614_05890 [Desulfuromonadales bacterium]|nr:hypothetical protein [Desulfuromonadales bacterium]
MSFPAAPGVIVATIVWRVPPPPVTPDTAVFRFAFAVNRSMVDKIVVSGRSPQQVVLAIPKPGE